MGTRVLRLDNQPHGSWQFETADAGGNVVFRAGGVFHAFVPNRQIIRTFEMEGFPAQLEFLEFGAHGEDRSDLLMHLIFRSVEWRDRLLRLPFARGLSLAHDRLQALFPPLHQTL
ncbi:MAG: hypothetical protein OHK0039_27220 [Bacteroidia bacterium]